MQKGMLNLNIFKAYKSSTGCLNHFHIICGCIIKNSLKVEVYDNLKRDFLILIKS